MNCWWEEVEPVPGAARTWILCSDAEATDVDDTIMFDDE